jgi:hypothetical protein
MQNQSYQQAKQINQQLVQVIQNTDVIRTINYCTYPVQSSSAELFVAWVYSV